MQARGSHVGGIDRDEENLIIGHLNVRSLFTGFEHFADLVIQNKFDVMCVTETWLDVDVSLDVVRLEGYSFIHKSRPGRGGGVGIYIQNDLSYREVFSDIQPVDGLEYILTEVVVGKLKFLVIAIYRSPSSNAMLVVNHLDDLVALVTPSYDNVLLLGDINIDHSVDNIASQAISSFGFSQIINEPTRVTLTSQKIIDVIYVNCTHLVTSTGTLNGDLISDHRAVFCTMKSSHFRSKPKHITYRDFKHFSHADFCLDLQMVPWDQVYYLDSIDDKVRFLTENIIALFDIHAPYVTSRVSKPFAPWLTPCIKKLMSDRNKALSKYKKSKLASDWVSYKQIRNQTLAAVRREQAAFIKFVHVNSGNKGLWSALRCFNIKSKQNCEIPVNLRDVNAINRYFSSVYSPPNSCPATTKQFLSSRYNESISFGFKMISECDVGEIILKLKSNSRGCDDLSALMLKYCAPAISTHITHIINCCLETGYFPEAWKLSLIKPLPKVKNPLKYSDLRPISLIPVLAKILERVVHVQVNDYLEANHIISHLQSGFRRGFSTTSVLANTSDAIFRAWDVRYISTLILLDFSKAFDTLDHDLLCAKLAYYGFDSLSVHFFKSYLANRGQVVLLDDLISEPGFISSGVPQGSVLGPILFLIYTSDIFARVKHTDIIAFADDTQLNYSFPPSNIVDACNKINCDLKSISDYAQQNNLKLNSSKSAVMCFCQLGKNKDFVLENLKLTLNGVFLHPTSSARNLGVLFDDDMRFRKHVSALVNKAYVALKLLYSNKDIFDFKLRKKLCESLVLPILHHAIGVYYSCLDNFTKNRLQKIQNSCCRYIFRLRRFDHVSHKIRELQWLDVSHLYDYHLSVFTHKILLTASPPYLYEKLIFRRNMHGSNLRNTFQLDIPKHRTSTFERSFIYNAVNVYNNLGSSLKSLPVNSFRKSVRQHFFSLQ